MQHRERLAKDEALMQLEASQAVVKRLRLELSDVNGSMHDVRELERSNLALQRQLRDLRERQQQTGATAVSAQESATRILELTGQVERLATENETLRVSLVGCFFFF